jgi:hypothetical protein
MNDFLNFKKMLTPTLIKFLFWVMLIVTVVVGIVTLFKSFLSGLLILAIGPLFVRVYCELLIVIFSINDTLTEIKNQGKP